MNRRNILALFSVGAGLLALYFIFRPAQEVCETPPELASFRVPLPNTAAAIMAGKPLVIVAIGSSSTEGAGASDSSHNYPSRLADELDRRLPGHKITIINKGVGGETAEQMVARFQHDVIEFKPQLVIWQTGSNAMLKGQSPEIFEKTLRTGVKQLRSGKIDVVLMDPQYAPTVIQRPLHRKFIDIIKNTAIDMKVAVLRRYDAMQYWTDSGTVEAGDLVARDKLHLNDLGYACIAKLLATSLIHAVKSPADQ
jgi:acyl-CoA thioesterase I